MDLQWRCHSLWLSLLVSVRSSQASLPWVLVTSAKNRYKTLPEQNKNSFLYIHSSLDQSHVFRSSRYYIHTKQLQRLLKNQERARQSFDPATVMFLWTGRKLWHKAPMSIHSRSTLTKNWKWKLNRRETGTRKGDERWRRSGCLSTEAGRTARTLSLRGPGRTDRPRRTAFSAL